MSAKKLFGVVSAMFVVSVAACASPTEDAGSGAGAETATTQTALSARCVSLRDNADEEAQGAVADAWADEDLASYDTCREALFQQAKANVKAAVSAKQTDKAAAAYAEFVKWGTAQEVEDDRIEDPAEAAPSGHDKGTVLVQVTDAKNPTSSRVVISGLPEVSASLDGVHRAATGRTGHHTPHGCYDATWADKNHHSSLYGSGGSAQGAPMPYSVFWYPAIALHVGNVGVASHGCVHLETPVAKAVYDAFESGYAVRVCVQ